MRPLFRNQPVVQAPSRPQTSPLVYWLAILIAAAAFQYFVPAFQSTRAGNVNYWAIDSADLGLAGPFRYLKDITVVLFGIAWVVTIGKGVHGLGLYFLWILSIVAIGFVGYVTGAGYSGFFSAGLRWILLVHAGFGIYQFLQLRPWTARDEQLLFRMIAAVCIVDAALTAYQVLLLARSLGALGALRLPGMFSLAATSGYFAAGIALIFSALKRVPASRRLFMMGLCFFIALLSGTRFALFLTLALLAPLSLQVMRTMKFPEVFISFYKFFFMPFVMVAAVIAVTSFVARGDMTEQFGSNGRFSNFTDYWSDIADSDISELLFGYGLGTGTNTAVTIAYSNNVSYAMNVTTDNSLLTTFSQVGAIGSLIFWLGILLAIYPGMRRAPLSVAAMFLLCLFVQNIAEQNFLIFGFGFVWGNAMREATAASRAIAATGVLGRRPVVARRLPQRPFA
ncbi:hypothetical protein SAMN02745157_4983 [Kaistia soli DSM 19436]|uniref:O-antigen ligase like membrane protein n=1 Tax=Kaistia soli DSM 19436 TaxID=1122133 RepID=A0A1M5NFD5_9HYPH|nr:hypothetical protein [Kaistia soli]SHG88185.1 hypothetical protein SAMN02745157_4983 [Kaistia soli DSM 19436]